MTQYMAWLDVPRLDRKVLHFQINGQWVRYDSSLCQRWRKPDLTTPGASKGFSTMQHALSMGVKLMASDVAKKDRMMPLSGLTEEQRSMWVGM